MYAVYAVFGPSAITDVQSDARAILKHSAVPQVQHVLAAYVL